MAGGWWPGRGAGCQGGVGRGGREGGVLGGGHSERATCKDVHTSPEMGQIIAVLYCTVLYYTPLSVTDGRTEKILVSNIGWLILLVFLIFFSYGTLQRADYFCVALSS